MVYTTYLWWWLGDGANDIVLPTWFTLVIILEWDPQGWHEEVAIPEKIETSGWL
jgi:hypothetical protein